MSARSWMMSSRIDSFSLVRRRGTPKSSPDLNGMPTMPSSSFSFGLDETGVEETRVVNTRKGYINTRKGKSMLYKVSNTRKQCSDLLPEVCCRIRRFRASQVQMRARTRQTGHIIAHLHATTRRQRLRTEPSNKNQRKQSKIQTKRDWSRARRETRDAHTCEQCAT